MLCAPALCASAFGQVRPTRTILVIHSGAESFPANPILDAGIREALASRSDISIDYFAEYLESDLFPGEQALSAFTDYVRRKYRGRRIDLVIAMTDTGLRFVLDYRDKLFPNVPIVYFGVTAPDERTRRAGGGITGIRVGVAYAQTLKLALNLQPSTRRVFVIARGVDARNSESVRTELSDVSQSVSVTYLNEETVPRLLSAVKAVPAGSVILYIWQSQMDPGNVLYPDVVAGFVADAASVPVYGTSDLYLGKGVVGGVMRGTRETGTRLGEMAFRILTGTRPQDIPIETARVMPIIDWRQVQRWGIAPSRLPAGARILFQQPSVWERYGIYVGALLTVLLMQALLIAGLLMQRTKLRDAEQHECRSQTALRRSYDRVRDLGLRLMDAQESERLRIARELHDDVSQQLAVLKIDLELLCQTTPDRAEVIADEAAKRVQEIGKSVHDLSHRLYPARLRLMGLVPALDGLRSELFQPGISIAFAHDNVPPALRADLTLCLFRIVQEALQNTLKHSQAHTVSVDLCGTPEGIALTIVDDGVGFEVDRARGNGLGLISMQERVESLGGTLDIRSSPGAGTRLVVRVPVAVLHDAATVAV
jgi:signal transduction histidine kinase